VPEIVGHSDADEVKRARAKFLALKRTQRRLDNRLADIDWEYDVLKPGLLALEKRITVLGELPEFTIVEEGLTDGAGEDHLGHS
jgi:hypothetical protein